MKLLFNCIAQHKLLAIFGILFGFILAFLEALTAALIIPLIFVLNTSEVASVSEYSKITQFILNIINDIPKQEKFLVLIIALILLTLIKNISLYISNISINKLMLKVGFYLRQKCLNYWLNQKVCFFSKSKLGELISSVNEHTQRSELLVALTIGVINSIFIISFLLIFLIILSPELTSFIVVSMAFLGLILRKIFKKVALSGHKVAQSIGNFSSVATEIISGIRLIKSKNAQELETQRFNNSLKERYKVELKAWMWQSAVSPITDFIGIILILSILSVSLFLYPNQSETLPLLSAYIIALMRMWPRITHLVGIRSQISQLEGSVDYINEMLKKTELFESSNQGEQFKGIKNGISFENVTYCYPGETIPVINNFNLKIEKGTTIALVGPSGSGKSTIADLLMIFDRPQQGKILIDGVELQDVETSSWRKAIGLVSQDNFLFNASIRENITYGLNSVTEDEIVFAAKNANIYDFIKSLPNGFDTIVGERGSKLSGGQRQRVAIARAIIHRSEILIFDEATSSLDNTSERTVQSAIELVSKNRTVIVITHRVSTIKQVDVIIFIAEGKILEQGSYEELMAKKGNFFKLQNVSS